MARMNIRRGKPSTLAPIDRKVDGNTRLRIVGVGIGDTVSGNAKWYAGDGDTYFWSGACQLDKSGLPTGPAPGIKVKQRADGTLMPLNDTEMRNVFGDFAYNDVKPKGAIAIQGNWAATNIVDLDTPILAHTGYAKIRVHKKASASFAAVFDDIVAAGLDDLILSCAGTFVPRHKGWDPTRGLSSHSWGVAIDFNVAWNGYGVTPAALGAKGSVRELVPIFERRGFAWGGYFGAPYQDGMHFELARLDL